MTKSKDMVGAKQTGHNFTILGFRTGTDPEYKKKCVDLWVEKGSAAKAAHELGVSPTTISYHAWDYLLTHLDEARNILDTVADEDDRYRRSLTDEEFMTLMVQRANRFYPVKKFESWVLSSGAYKYPAAVEVYKRRYPMLHAKHTNLRNSEKIQK